jgi:hypothetical protein
MADVFPRPTDSLPGMLPLTSLLPDSPLPASRLLLPSACPPSAGYATVRRFSPTAGRGGRRGSALSHVPLDVPTHSETGIRLERTFALSRLLLYHQSNLIYETARLSRAIQALSHKGR